MNRDHDVAKAIGYFLAGAVLIAAMFFILQRQKHKPATGTPIGAGTLSTVFDNSHHVGCYIFTPREERYPPMISCVQLTDTTNVKPDGRVAVALP